MPCQYSKGWDLSQHLVQADWKLNAQVAAFKVCKYIHSCGTTIITQTSNQTRQFGGFSLVLVAKTGVLDRSISSLRGGTLQSLGRSSVFLRSLFIVGCCTGGGVFGDTASLPLLPVSVWSFSLCYGGAVQLVFRSFSEEIDPHVAAGLVCPWEDMSSGSQYTAILNPVPALTSYIYGIPNL